MTEFFKSLDDELERLYRCELKRKGRVKNIFAKTSELVTSHEDEQLKRLIDNAYYLFVNYIENNLPKIKEGEEIPPVKSLNQIHNFIEDGQQEN